MGHWVRCGVVDKGRLGRACAMRCSGMFALCDGRHADAVGVGTLCTPWCGGPWVLYDAGGCCVVGERGYNIVF